ncbi:hypothetical protein C8J56DRAFT_1005077 [Mycena floridula]|nr:hypothetical protein C8J56DRAFT_1005077 [Mycena floridula]
MQLDLRNRYHALMDAAHQGIPEIVSMIHSGRAGRPKTVIDPTWLRWAYSQQTTAGIARFLQVGRTVVRQQLLEHGIVEPDQPPDNFIYHSSDEDEEDPLDPQDCGELPPIRRSNRHTDICDDDLDVVILELRSHFHRAGVRMLNGMLRRMGYHIQYERIRLSLLCIDPVQRVFDRIRIRISVHNVRIERLWVDVTAQVGGVWAELFHMLETTFGLDINNQNHIWLLQYLFLHTINQQLQFFAESWNDHSIQVRGGASRTPADMFAFDMLVHGIRGAELEMTEEELEVFGIDWDSLNDDAVRQSQLQNNPQSEEATSWLGRIGPPENLNEILVESPETVFEDQHTAGLDAAIQEWMGRNDRHSVAAAWSHGLAYARHVYGPGF